ncbi:tryptophan 2,3-dioxygenase family protein [Arenibacter sp. F20364]|uniref:tryptophan 2,3-dioxygenase family protein n=1 Tax=Arenibacter sp. F20364 TaxID=2926415 RepID=UPI001FF29D2E|nr:tryptophan 2,3-dioxygenase family protein [Arenibacter sp. F20364]MCK0189818.1 tryptophan 2,3-dioxygenase family protein [Arenibacter sp. F20364]
MANITDKLVEKYVSLGENPETYLEGLLHAKPITYWDYVEVDSLLSLQKPRTNFKDESIFIMYHQVTELYLKMMLHELQQIVGNPTPSTKFLTTKLDRLIKYTSMLINSFDIMKVGMDYEDYNTFRKTLTPASGFQSAQFRFIELHCTSLANLISHRFKKGSSKNPDLRECFEHIYWKDAGTDPKTGQKTLTLQLFEDRYLRELTETAKTVMGHTLEDKLAQLPYVPDALRNRLRTFDQLYNIDWPMVHLNTAEHYLDKKGENKEATGGSEWKKYLHPKYQQRKFFPDLWTETEKKNWGINHKNKHYGSIEQTRIDAPTSR